MNETVTQQKAFQKLAALCSRREYCQHDIIEKMRQWGIDEEEQATIMAHLLQKRFIDDERYCRAFVHDKLRYNQWGPVKIRQALRIKQVDDNIIRAVLEEVQDNDFLQILQPILLQKKKTIKAHSEYERNSKLIRWAMSKGFTLEQIHSCLSEQD